MSEQGVENLIIPGKSIRRTTSGPWLGATLALCLLAILASHRSPVRYPTQPAAAAVRPPAIRPPRTPSEAALREARRLWAQAVRRVKPVLEAEAEADLEGAPSQEPERQRLMATHEGATLGRAADAARHAVSLARTPDQRYHATLWLALIECDRGHHREELRLAQRLVEMRPRNADSLAALRRAARCNGRSRLEQQADTALKALPEAPPSAALEPVRRSLRQPIQPRS